jgi:hypothetical protein
VPLAWEVQSLRLSLFLKEPIPTGQSLWQLFVGQEPEIDERRAKEALHRQAGTWRTGLLDARVTPVRIDVLFGPPPPAFTTAPEMPKLTCGPWRDTVTAFFERGTAMLSELRMSPFRIAIGATVLASADNKTHAYEQLRTCLRSVQVEPARMRDFMYRVNWPVRFDEAAIELNRLTTFAAEQLMISVMQPPAMDQVFGEQNYAKLELDHNSTVTNKEVLELGRLVSIFEKLKVLAFENFERGECI